jgi:septal ring factor EnvC (AmiA/AmiB activator)
MATSTIDLNVLPTPGDGRPIHKRPRRRHPFVALITVLILAGVAFGLVVHDEIRTNTQADRTHRALDVTRAHLRMVVANLTTVRHQVHVLAAQVSQVTQALAADEANLKVVQTELTNEESDVSHQTALIADLQTCLGGVQKALNALSVADQSRAIGSLNSVSSNCSDAAAVADG